MGLTESLRDLARVRVQEAEAKEAVQRAQAALEATPEHLALQVAQANAKAAGDAVYALSRAVREYALEAYQATGDKKPCEYVSIRMFKRYVYDAHEVFDWLFVNAPAYLTVDTKRFESAANTLPGAPVRIENDPRPAIAGDLSALLEEEVAEVSA